MTRGLVAGALALILAACNGGGDEKGEGGDPLEADSVKKVIAAAENDFGSSGRLVIRKSGTEPLIRVMAEGDDSDQVERWVNEICASVEKAAA